MDSKTNQVIKTRGRPKKVLNPKSSKVMSKSAIIEHAFELAKSEALSEISIIKIANDFGVVPGLIHYYIGNRDDLLSGVINLYFKKRTLSISNLKGSWQEKIKQICHISLKLMLEYPGVVEYVATQNKYRLFQKVEEGETDYGLEFFNIICDTLREGKLKPKVAALGYHLIMQHQTSCALGEIGKLSPAKHNAFISNKLDQLDSKRYQGAKFISKEFAKLDTNVIFDTGLEILLKGLESKN